MLLSKIFKLITGEQDFLSKTKFFASTIFKILILIVPNALLTNYCLSYKVETHFFAVQVNSLGVIPMLD